MASIYNKVRDTAKYLKEDFPKLTDYEALQIASRIQISETLEDGLQTGVSGQPAFLEAIAMVLGYTGDKNRWGHDSIKDVLTAISTKGD